MTKSVYRQSLGRILDSVEARDKSFLVTGATGLIGSYMVDLLMMANERGANNRVYALGRSGQRLRERFEEHLDSPLFHCIEQDVTHPLDNSLSFDFIIHGASNADPASYAAHPVQTITTNLLGGINVLEYAAIHKGCRVILLSTFEVYGQMDHDVYDESSVGILDFNLIRSGYPGSKRVIETLARSYVSEYGIDARIARLASIYGPTMLPGDSKAHAQFIRSAIEGKDIVLKSKGEQRRTYCYVADAVSGILCALFRGAPGEAYNVSNENAIVSISGLARLIADIAGVSVVYDSPSDIERSGYSKPQNCILDNGKLKSLGWEGRYTVSEGIRECLAVLGFN
ncbi:MAG: NAD-dependent epimerase/dehydratase family protein [Bacteroidales bacterium]|nr:NAD-dependent epimerase/dehydratase family protein [Bacteroidales bacterium]